ncbi:MAG: hypothetical protein V7K41_15815 [Nostoc sp.]|uniref:hypothetical protein n=1 Tax=Nostoc sp. TaxID=1180 RepID=UPI002FFA13B0
MDAHLGTFASIQKMFTMVIQHPVINITVMVLISSINSTITTGSTTTRPEALRSRYVETRMEPIVGLLYFRISIVITI